MALQATIALLRDPVSVVLAPCHFQLVFVLYLSMAAARAVSGQHPGHSMICVKREEPFGPVATVDIPQAHRFRRLCSTVSDRRHTLQRKHRCSPPPTFVFPMWLVRVAPAAADHRTPTAASSVSYRNRDRQPRCQQCGAEAVKSIPQRSSLHLHRCFRSLPTRRFI